MGSSSTPDSPAVRVAVTLHTLDVTLASMPDPATRAALLAAVATWLQHHAPEQRKQPR